MKKDYFFNALSGLADASEAVIMSMIITRITTLKDAGYVTTAFAVGILLLTIGKYGVYNYQVSDCNSRFSFAAYFFARITTTLIMLLFLAGYLVYGKLHLSYDSNKMLIILFIGLIYATESMEDLLRAHYQSFGKLYVGSIFFLIRWCARIISFTLTIILTKSTSLALGIAFISSFIILLLCFFYSIKNNIIRESHSITSVPSTASPKSLIYQVEDLLKDCFPLFLSTFLSFYILNSPKYAIENNLTPELQACYGFVSMPIFAISMVNSFIFLPQLKNLSTDYKTGRKKAFDNRITRQYLLIFSLTVVFIIASYFYGTDFLSILFHTQLHSYTYELIILMLSGGFLALSNYQSAILTIMRKQKSLFKGYLATSILSLILISPSVNKFGTRGAASAYLGLIIFLCTVFEASIRNNPDN